MTKAFKSNDCLKSSQEFSSSCLSGMHFDPPQAGFTSVSKLWKIHQRVSGKEISKELEQSILTNLSKNSSYLFDSGKTALLRVFEFLRTQTSKNLVGLSAYSCPDIALAANQAGFTVMPLECDYKTIEIKKEEILNHADSLACIVLSNLYGLVDSVETIGEISKLKIPIIDDASQAGLSSRNGKRVGSADGVIGIYSFGRGKSFCGIGGGLVTISDKSDFFNVQAISNYLKKKSELYKIDLYDGVLILSDILKSFLFDLFQKPEFYWCLKKLPFLGLGQTKIPPSIEPRALAYIKILHILWQMENQDERARYATEAVADYQGAFKGTDIYEPYIERTTEGQIMIRYPIIFSNENLKNKVFRELEPYGVSNSYPKLLKEFSELKLVKTETPNAYSISRNILTLPTHKFISADDRKLIINKIQQIAI